MEVRRSYPPPDKSTIHVSYMYVRSRGNGISVSYFPSVKHLHPTNNMARIFITGSSDGIGQAAAKPLTEQGHKVWLHARSQSRAKEAKAAVPNVEGVIIGDLTSIEDTKHLASEANKNGPWDSIVHNAGLGPSNSLGNTGDGLPSTFQVNSLAPYILTALMDKPKRLLYLSSGLHSGGSDDLKTAAKPK